MSESIDAPAEPKAPLVRVRVTATRKFDRYDAYTIRGSLKPADIRRHLLEGEPGMLLASQAVAILRQTLGIPIQVSCPRCKETMTYTPTHAPSKLQVSAALSVLNHTAGKPIERSERVLRDAEYARITVEAIRAVLPKVRESELRKIGARIIEALAEDGTQL
jgi:hypothetical protein